MTTSEARGQTASRSAAPAPARAQRTPEEVAEKMRDVDGFAGAAGHELSDPRVRGIVERAVAGEAVDAALPGDEHIAFG